MSKNLEVEDYSPIIICEAPFMLQDADHAIKYQKSDVLHEIMNNWSEKTNAKMLSGTYFGVNCISSNKPIVTLEDIKGMRVRVPDHPFFMEFYNAVGANPTPIAMAEVYMALQQGVVGASNNPLPVTYSSKYYEVQEYYNLTKHHHAFVYLVVSDKVWNNLNEQQRNWLQVAADIFAEESTKLVVEQELSLQSQLEKSGDLKFIVPDREAFKEKSKSVISNHIRNGLYSQEMVDRIQALIK